MNLTLMNRNDVCDYIIERLSAARIELNQLKLQKLLYYVQAWHLAFYETPLFDGRFQAWVHGPVNRELYDRFKPSKTLYSEITLQDVSNRMSFARLSPHARAHIDSILDSYAGYTGSQLEEMTHAEAPWKEARSGYATNQRCERELSEMAMRAYYSARLR